MPDALQTRFLALMRFTFTNEKPRLAPFTEEEFAALTELASEHKLLPMTVDASAACGLLPEGERVEMVKKIALLRVADQTARTAEAHRILRLLEARGIYAFTVKGELCTACYPNPALRVSGDADLLVPQARFAEACDLFESEGYSPDKERRGDEFEVGYRKPGSALYAEVHRSLFDPEDPVFQSEEFRFAAEGEGTVYETENGFRCRSFPPHEHLRYLILHAFKHFIGSGFGLRQVCDIGLWAERYAAEIDWERLKTECKRVHCFRFTQAVFAICAGELGIVPALPACWTDGVPDYRPLLEDLFAAGIYGSATMSRAHSATVTRNAVEANRTSRRSGVLRSVFPSRKSLQGRYPVLEKHPILLPGVWAARICGYAGELLRSGGDNSATESVRIGKERAELLKYYEILE